MIASERSTLSHTGVTGHRGWYRLWILGLLILYVTKLHDLYRVRRPAMSATSAFCAWKEAARMLQHGRNILIVHQLAQ